MEKKLETDDLEAHALARSNYVAALAGEGAVDKLAKINVVSFLEKLS